MGLWKESGRYLLMDAGYIRLVLSLCKGADGLSTIQAFVACCPSTCALLLVYIARVIYSPKLERKNSPTKA